ncbi:MAG: hypothetical protein WCG48_02200 [Candidatus Berkelbacteria bacterium]
MTEEAGMTEVAGAATIKKLLKLLLIVKICGIISAKGGQDYDYCRKKADFLL